MTGLEVLEVSFFNPLVLFYSDQVFNFSQAFVFSLGAFILLLSLFMVGVVVILAVREVLIYFII